MSRFAILVFASATLAGCMGVSFEGLRVTNHTSEASTIEVRILCDDMPVLEQTYSMGPGGQESARFSRPSGQCMIHAEAGNRSAESDPTMDNQVHWFFVDLYQDSIETGIVVS